MTLQDKTQVYCWFWSVQNRNKGGVPAGPQVLVGKALDWEGASLLHAWPCPALWEVVESLTRSEPSSSVYRLSQFVLRKMYSLVVALVCDIFVQWFAIQ